jgi:hypothetical protein
LLVLYVEYEAVHELETRMWFPDPDKPPDAPEGLPVLCDYVDAIGFVRDLVFGEEWRFAGQHDWPVLEAMQQTQQLIDAALQLHLEAAAVGGAPPHWRPVRFEGKTTNAS